MKSLKIISFILMGFGMLLYLVSILFEIQHWPDIFKGHISGPIIAFIGALIFILSLILRQKQKENAL